MKKSIIIGASIASVALLIACGSSPEEPTSNDVEEINQHANKGNPAPTAPKTKNITSGDWEIGEKDELEAGVITPGTYIVTATENGFNCYWSTVKDFDQELTSIIANGNISPGEKARVVVKSSYAGLTLKGDCLAVKKK